MSIFDNILGNWIQIVDDQNGITIDDYGYDTGVIEGTTGNHCVKCVAVNRCCFKNEANKKPEPFNTTGIKLLDIILDGLTPGLYHFGCHCKEIPVNLNIGDIELVIPDGKIDYMFSSKLGWINAMGYYELDRENFVQVLFQQTKKSYLYGEYYIVDHTKYGCKVNLIIYIPGANDKIGKRYKIKTNYMIFPNGKLKMNTPLGGWEK